MLITIVSVNVNKVVKGKTSYSVAEVTYQKEGGQEFTQKVVSFGNKDVYQTASKAQPGEAYEVVSEKNDKDYWEFKSMELVTGSSEAPKGTSFPSSSKTGAAQTSPKSTYETPEERALRRAFEVEKQRLIVRQSSLGQAMEYTKGTQPKGITSSADDIMMLAEQFATWVHMKPHETGIKSILDMDDDIIY